MAPNRLVDASSAYLRQHADNPVEWWEWCDEAFDEARESNRPVLLSIGYAACHWCHVMAHESFEDPDIAAQLNMMFVPIKVDREERPDLDAVFMAACQALTGSGGWPLTVFLTPDRRPFAAGTYFPPKDRDGQMGLPSVMTTIFNYWRMRRDEVDKQAARLAEAIEREMTFVDSLVPSAPAHSWSAINESLASALVERAADHGGFTGAPKFPRPSYVESLLLRWDDPACRAVATTTLDAMARGGLYDHLEGGFARYSVDDQWRVPHFEKMLSDQALLALTYLRAARLPQANPEWRDVAVGTLAFTLAHLDLGGGFASSLDADSDGEEGAHVTWTIAEVRNALAGLPEETVAGALERWTINDDGDLDGRSVPRLDDAAPFVTPPALADAAARLRAHRAERPQPGRDEKIICEWNAMLAVALCEAGGAFATRAEALVASLFDTHHHEGRWFRTEARNADATASDLGWLLRAALAVYGRCGDDVWLERARALTRYLFVHHWDGELPSASTPDVGLGVITSSNLTLDFLVGPKEIFDGATPSAHAVVTDAFARLALIDDDADLMAVARRLVHIGSALLHEHPVAVPDLVAAAALVLDPLEIVIPGPVGAFRDEVDRHCLRAAVLVVGTGTSPLLQDRVVGSAYVCRGQVCELPASDVATLAAQLEATRS